MSCSFLLHLGVVLVGAVAVDLPPAKPPATPEGRALAYLAREVPRWKVENKCYSCHNNGDAARALYTAARLHYPIPAGALDDTSRWLARPDQWDRNGGAAGSSDKGLARIQFAAALVEGLEAGRVKDRRSLSRAAELVAEYQRPDGAWKVDADGTVGSPATYGSCLATYQARRVLQKADARRFQPAITRAERWLSKVPIKTALDAAAVLLALADSDNSDADAQRRQCLVLIRKSQSREGGWGAHVTAPPEPFDTAVVLLALNPLAGQPDLRAMLRRGRAYLVSAQQPDGSWPETTRPPGADSYAQRLSTAGWATLALLATGDRPKPSGR